QRQVAGGDVADVRADGDDLGPRQALGHLRGGRDEDAGTGPALALRLRDLHEDPVVEHRDRLLALLGGHARHGTAQPGRTVTPFAARWSFTWRAVSSPKWNTDAASTASARPATAPSTKSSSPPTPPLAMTGSPQASTTARVSSTSKPSRVPSRSIDVSRISPAPSFSHSAAHDTAHKPVGLRPPWVWT